MIHLVKYMFKIKREMNEKINKEINQWKNE